jgi:hypothetical protein
VNHSRDVLQPLLRRHLLRPLRPSNLRLLPPRPVDRRAPRASDNELWRLIAENIPQSIRALRAAPGFSKLIAYRMTPPRSLTNLH